MKLLMPLTLVLLVGSLTSASARGLEETRTLVLIPLPTAVAFEGDGFTVSDGTVVTGPDRITRLFVADVMTDTGLRLTAGTAGPIRFELRPDNRPAGAYELTSGPDGVLVTAGKESGLFYGAQTLRQLLQNGRIPGVRVQDEPRYTWRGSMLDVARHFFPVEEVERYIDLMAAYKLNVLHLHLTDDQGWRIAIDGRPELTQVGGRTQVGDKPGGFYTAEDYGEVIAYAAERFIDVVPEIDVPAHTNAALASDPSLNCDGRARQPYTGTRVVSAALCPGAAAVQEFLRDVFTDLGRLTPGRYLHIGGDEAKMLNNAEYREIVEEAQQSVLDAGKQVVGWMEIGGARLSKGTLIQYWGRDEPSDAVVSAVNQGAEIIMSPASRTYLDMKYDDNTPLGKSWAGLISVKDSYDWNPATLVKGVPEESIVGVEAPLWTETVRSFADATELAFPRLPAVAEVAWTPQAARDYTDFAARLAAQAPRWAAWKLKYHRTSQIEWIR
jgi:hexosaminidase